MFVSYKNFNQNVSSTGAAIVAALSIGEDMIFRPTRSKRNVVLVIKSDFTSPSSSPDGDEAKRISRICALFASPESITEGVFDHHNEATLLQLFWNSIAAEDRIYGTNIDEAFALVRRRSWKLNVIPSREITLQQVYRHEFYDTQRLWMANRSTSALYRASSELLSSLPL
ncbi:hypothetical protein BH10ACI4_BH10ACI4_34630 [soil metagenome]